MPNPRRQQQMKIYNKLYTKKRLAQAREYLGDKCLWCGSKDDLQFDHIKPENKVGNLSNMARCSTEKFWNEVKKCQLLCRDCHKWKSRIDRSLRSYREKPHGVQRYNVWGCRCSICSAAKSAYEISRKARLLVGR